MLGFLIPLLLFLSLGFLIVLHVPVSLPLVLRVFFAVVLLHVLPVVRPIVLLLGQSPLNLLVSVLQCNHGLPCPAKLLLTGFSVTFPLVAGLVASNNLCKVEVVQLERSKQRMKLLKLALVLKLLLSSPIVLISQPNEQSRGCELSASR